MIRFTVAGQATFAAAFTAALVPVHAAPAQPGNPLRKGSELQPGSATRSPWRINNLAVDGTTHVASEYLEVIAIRDQS